MAAAKIVSTSVVSNAEKALKEAVIRVIRDHKKTGDPVIVWRGGRVVKANPKKLLAR
jgi:hypothetical protein